MRRKVWWLFVSFMGLTSILLLCHRETALAHSGGTNTDGCHTNRKTGDYHCHNAKPKSSRTPRRNGAETSTEGAGLTQQQQRNEAAYNTAFCARVGGETEVRHEYTYPVGQSHVRVDCETSDTVYEGGLDRHSSLDSVQQALFFAALTGKKPTVVIYDTDGQIGEFEHRIQVACERAGVTFLSVP